MSEQEYALENYLNEILDGENSTFNFLSLQYKDQFIAISNRLDVSNLDMLSNSLEVVADELFKTKNDHIPYISSFLLFSMEVDRLCMVNYDWYSRNTLVKILVRILNKKCFVSNSKRCDILKKICSN